MQTNAAVTAKQKSCRTSLTLDRTVKEMAGTFFEELGMDMSTGVNIILKNMLRTGKFPASLDLHYAPVRIADIDTEGKELRAIYAVQNRDTIPSVKEQRGYVMSFDTELNRPVRIYDDGRREPCE